jgi:hypothetical protein
MSDEKPTGSGGMGGDGGSAQSHGDADATPAPVVPLDRRADRYRLVNLGFQIKQSGEAVMRTGSLANTIAGDQRASQLLIIRQLILDLIPMELDIAAELQEQARLELNSALR